MPPTRAISNRVGRMLKVVKRIRNSMPVGAALDDPAEAAGLALEMEAQRQRMEMAEDFEREVADRALRHRREDRIADFAHRLRQHARQRRRPG